MNTNDGGAAFPQTVRGWNDHLGGLDQRGMTLHAYYAGQALTGLVAAGPFVVDGMDTPVGEQLRAWAGDIAEQAHVLADAMIAQRAKAEGKGG